MQIGKETNAKLANMDGDHNPEPRNNMKRRNKKFPNRKRRRTRKKFMDDSIRDAKSNLNNWRQLQKNVKLAFKLRKKFKIFLHKKDKKSEKSLQMPPTPHNTGQYLMSNYCQVRHEKLFNYSSDYLHRDIYSNLIENAAIEDLCVTGGSMKGIINSHPFRRDSDDFSTSFSITNNNVPEEDSMNAAGDSSASYLNSEYSYAAQFEPEYRLMNDNEHFHTDSLEARLCREKIEEQKKLIELLMHQIKSQNG